MTITTKSSHSTVFSQFSTIHILTQGHYFPDKHFNNTDKAYFWPHVFQRVLTGIQKIAPPPKETQDILPTQVIQI
jgi:hypothetical protein